MLPQCGCGKWVWQGGGVGVVVPAGPAAQLTARRTSGIVHTRCCGARNSIATGCVKLPEWAGRHAASWVMQHNGQGAVDGLGVSKIQVREKVQVMWRGESRGVQGDWWGNGMWHSRCWCRAAPPPILGAWPAVRGYAE